MMDQLITTDFGSISKGQGQDVNLKRFSQKFLAPSFDAQKKHEVDIYPRNLDKEIESSGQLYQVAMHANAWSLGVIAMGSTFDDGLTDSLLSGAKDILKGLGPMSKEEYDYYERL